MSSTFGKNFKVSIFGEASSDLIGVVIEGIEPGTKLDFSLIRRDLDRHVKNLNTRQKEYNACRIISGCSNNITTPGPICVTIENNGCFGANQNSQENILKPSSADLALYYKFGRYSNIQCGGHISLNMNAAFIVAGSIAKQILYNSNIIVAGHIYSIGKTKDREFDPLEITPDMLYSLASQSFPVLNQNIKEKMQNEIQNSDKLGDTLGGSVECAVINLPVGIGDPLFRPITGVISGAVFSIPQACSIEFGISELSSIKGSSANDQLYISGGSIKTKTNNYGGVNFGMTNSNPLIFKAMFSPPHEILLKQDTVNIDSFENSKIKINSNRAACLIPSLVPVVEAMASIAILDMII